VANTQNLFRNGAVGFIDWLGGILPATRGQVFYHLPSIIEQGGEHAKEKTREQDLKEPILLTCNVEQISMIAELIDLPSGWYWACRTDALKVSENGEGREKSGEANCCENDHDESTPVHT